VRLEIITWNHCHRYLLGNLLRRAKRSTGPHEPTHPLNLHHGRRHATKIAVPDRAKRDIVCDTGTSVRGNTRLAGEIRKPVSALCLIHSSSPKHLASVSRTRDNTGEPEPLPLGHRHIHPPSLLRMRDPKRLLSSHGRRSRSSPSTSSSTYCKIRQS
jgi:hypothetical protein